MRTKKSDASTAQPQAPSDGSRTEQHKLTIGSSQPKRRAQLAINAKEVEGGAQSDWMFRRGGGNHLVNWLAIDSWIDSNLYDTWLDIKDRWNGASAYFSRFRLSGGKRIISELGSEALTLGTVGLAAMLVLAIPAFEAVDREDWLATGKYSVTFLDSKGNEIGKRGILHSDAVPLVELPDYLIKATLATEDRRFFEHFGIDVIGTLRALVENLRASEVVQGGSSLTQQLAKNLFLSSERSLDRKIKEAFLAIWLESRLSKKEILKLYLDRAYMGGGAFGVEAASQFYYGKSVRDISLAEAAVLAGLYKAPTKYAPHVNLAASRLRAMDVLDNLVEAGFLTEGQVHGARINPAQFVPSHSPNSPDWFLDWAFEEVRRLLQGRDDFVVTAKTTIDLSLQNAAESTVESILQRHGRAKRVKQAALVAMETNGAVRAMVGGRDYGESQFNRASHAKRQPGSSFKPYVYLTALEHGYRPRSTVRDAPFSCGRKHTVKNYSGGYRGRMPMSRALAKSVNTVAVKLSHEVGRKTVLTNLEKLGIKGVRPSCTMALGDTGITPLEHTAAYAAFANGGLSLEPFGITEIRNSQDEMIYFRERDEPKPVRLFDPDVIAGLNYMLGEVVTAGTGRRAQLDFTTAAGKTGTSTSYRDAWFMGYTGKFVTGVWYGNDNYRPTNRVTGGSLPAMTWRQFMTAAHSSPNIPKLLGLPLHPNQIAELERIALMRRTNPTQDVRPIEEQMAMSEATRELLKKMTEELKKASTKSATDASNKDDRASLDLFGSPRGAGGATTDNRRRQ